MSQTPGASRRFLPPSSASTKRVRFGTSVSRHRPSESQLSLSSTPSFPRGFRFQTPTKPGYDEIANSVEDVEHVSASGKLQIFTPYATIGPDAISEDEATIDEEGVVQHHHHDTDVGFDSDNEHVPKLIQAANDDNDDDDDDYDFKTPLSKRRKLDGDDIARQPPILLPSSPPFHGSDHLDHAMEDESSDADLYPSLPPQPLKSPPISSRFKVGVPKALLPESSSDQKPVFRPPEMNSRFSADVTAILPEAFTPSKRKGRQNYVAGGLAETIRNSILGIATEAAAQGGLREKHIRIQSVSEDASGRAVFVTDVDGLRWLLPISEDHFRIKEPQEKLEKLYKHAEIVVYGDATQWRLPTAEDAGHNTNLQFAAHWDISCRPE